jgi:tetratricopeptide (TPR) repeat protein
MQRKADATSSFQDAEAAFERALSLNLKTAETYTKLAELYRIWAEHDAGKAELRDVHIAKGLRAVEVALAIHPRMAEALGTRGMLYVLESRAGRTAAERESSSSKARASFDEAKRRNPLLGPDLDAWLTASSPAPPSRSP